MKKIRNDARRISHALDLVAVYKLKEKAVQVWHVMSVQRGGTRFYLQYHTGTYPNQFHLRHRQIYTGNISIPQHLRGRSKLNPAGERQEYMMTPRPVPARPAP